MIFINERIRVWLELFPLWAAPNENRCVYKMAAEQLVKITMSGLISAQMGDHVLGEETRTQAYSA